MTLPVNPMPAVFLPDSAPFTPEQRSWLNGFFAGLVALNGEGATTPPLPALPPAQQDDGQAPWHDQSLSMHERMNLAQGRPLNRRIMAAMAQQDCGQCGYNCRDYADALFAKKESRLNLCVPGGKETARMLKTLCEELDGKAALSFKELAQPLGVSRDNPKHVVFLSRKRLNKEGSEKETWHVELDLTGSGIGYRAGDSFGIFPTNAPALVQAIIAVLGASPDYPIRDCTLREVLAHSCALNQAPDALFQLISYLTGGERRQKAKALAAGEDPDGDAANIDVLAALEKFSGVNPDPEAFVEALEPLQPRLYSISSSPLVDPNRVSLTIDAVRYPIGRRTRLGVASTFFADRIDPGSSVKAYVQRAHSFSMPEDPEVPMIMVGPGTGIAPFRAFLHERKALGAKGRNWLFFGHQRSNHDFFYEDELTRMKASGVLTRLTLAWSRDSDQKIYVQDRMRDVGRDLWAWLASGAHFYVCGDAKRMAKDVERALVDVVAAHGARSTDEAIAFVADLKKRGRYRQDVY